MPIWFQQLTKYQQQDYNNIKSKQSMQVYC